MSHRQNQSNPGDSTRPAAYSISSSANNNTLPVNTSLSFTGNITRPSSVTADISGTISITPCQGSSASISPSSSSITFDGPTGTSVTASGFTTGSTAGDVAAELSITYNGSTTSVQVQVTITSS